MNRKMNSDAEKLKEFAKKLSNLDIGEIRMKTKIGKERYLEALERLLCVVAYLRKDF